MNSKTNEAVKLEALWDVGTLAEYLSVSRSWVYQSAAAGTIPCIRLGAALRFEPAAIQAWLNGEHGGNVVRLPSCR